MFIIHEIMLLHFRIGCRIMTSCLWSSVQNAKNIYRKRLTISYLLVGWTMKHFNFIICNVDHHQVKTFMKWSLFENTSFQHITENFITRFVSLANKVNNSTVLKRTVGLDFD